MADGRVPRESGAEAGGGHQGLRRSKPKTGVEMEKQVFQRAKNKEEYLNMWRS